MKQYAVVVTSVFNNGKDYRTEFCRNKADAERRKRYYEKDLTVSEVEIIKA